MVLYLPFTFLLFVVACPFVLKEFRGLRNGLLSSGLSETGVIPGISSLAEYASGRAGGKIVLSLTTPTMLPQASLIRRLLRNTPRPGSPWAALSEDMQLESCWLLGGKSGQLGVSLSRSVRISHVVVDHHVDDILTAPRQMILWGLVDGEENVASFRDLHAKRTGVIPEKHPFPAISGGLSFVPLSSLEYDSHAANLTQTFPIFPFIVDSGMDFKVIVLEVLGNWGGTSTRLYRFRVYGG